MKVIKSLLFLAKNYSIEAGNHAYFEVYYIR